MGNKCARKSYEVADPPEPPNNGVLPAPKVTGWMMHELLDRAADVAATSSDEPPAAAATGTDMEQQKKAFVCKKHDLKDEEARTFEVDDVRFLLVRRGDKFFAVGNKCTHYAAPLGKGVYCSGHVRCPWHGALFSVETGDIEDFPGLDSLPTFQISVDDDDVNLLLPTTAEREQLKSSGNARTKHMTARKDDETGETVVIVGGGASAVACAEALRQEGHSQRVVIVSDEQHLPYDRPKLSKQMDAKPDKIKLRSGEFFAKHDIEVQLNSKVGCKVTEVDTDAKQVKLESGDSIDYDKLVLATGGGARQLTCPGADLGGVCYIRTPEDTQRVAELADGEKHIVIIGSSFIGMEAAAALAKKNEHITAIDILPAPFALVLGSEVGNRLKQLHESNGVKFHMNNGVEKIEGADGRVSAVVLNDGSSIRADLVIAGIGCTPNTQFLHGCKIELDQRGFVPVDDCMKTNIDGVYAVGDICTFPLHCFDLDRVNIQHWQMAKKHGRTAALSIVGRPKPVVSVPFFWSMMFGKGLRYAGYGPGYDDVHINGDLEALKFAAYYFKDDHLRAVATIGADPTAAQVAELILAKKHITKQQVVELVTL